MYEGMEMRKVLVEELVKYMKDNDNIIVLDADLGKASGTIAIKDRTNNRHFEAGIAEANMVSIAAGLSSYGFIPFVSSFTPFATRRVADQIAISCAYAKQNVRIIGTDPGIAAEYNGGTHMSMEDVAIVRGIPNVVIFEPVDKTMLVKAMPSILEFNGTMYIRLWRKNATDIFDDNYKFDLFKGDMVKVGKDVTIVTSGYMLQQALKAAEQLAEQGIDAEIVNIHTIKPIDAKMLVDSASKTGCVVTCENHNVMGGLFSAVAEVLTRQCVVPMEAVAVNDTFGEVGKLDELATKFNLTDSDIVEAVKKVISRKK